MKYKVGDKVICLVSYGMSTRLIAYKEYTVTKVDNDTTIQVDNIAIWVVEDRFVLATDASRLLYKT